MLHDDSLAADRAVIYYNHKDGTETITLKDIEAALAEAGFGSVSVCFAVRRLMGGKGNGLPRRCARWRARTGKGLRHI